MRVLQYIFQIVVFLICQQQPLPGEGLDYFFICIYEL